MSIISMKRHASPHIGHIRIGTKPKPKHLASFTERGEITNIINSLNLALTYREGQEARYNIVISDAHRAMRKLAAERKQSR